MLLATKRTKLGTSESRRLRKVGIIPAIIYRKNFLPLSIALQEKEITKLYKQLYFKSTLLSVQVEQEVFTVLPKIIQLNPIRDTLNHIEFIAVSQDSDERVNIAINYLNKERALGVKRGGFFNIIKRSVLIKCHISKLINSIDIDVSNMKIGEILTCSQLFLPEGYILLDNEKTVIASIVGKSSNKEEDNSVVEEK